MKEFHLLALKSEKDELFRRLQIFRNVQFTDMKEDESLSGRLGNLNITKEFNDVDTATTRCKYCLGQLSRYYPSKGGLKALKEGLPNYTFREMEDKVKDIDFDMIYERIKRNGDSLDGIRFDLNKAYEEIEDLTVFRKLDIIPYDLNKLKKASCYIGSVPIKSKNELEQALGEVDNLHYELIGLRKDEAMYIIFFHSSVGELVEDIIKAKGFSKQNLDLREKVSKRIDLLYQDIENLKKRKKDKKKELGDYVKYRQDIELYFEYVSNYKVRIEANELCLASEATCYIQGYFPSYQENEFVGMIQEVTSGANSLEILDAKVDSAEVPIMLKNNKLFSIFEPVTATYAMPRYNEIDPTPFLAPFYAFFFGMMAADVGYGLLVLLACLLALGTCNLKPSMKKSIKFFAIVSIFTGFWGFIYNSYFGFKLDFMPQFLDMGSQAMDILLISIVFGGIHLFTGLGIKAYMYLRDGRPTDAIFDVLSWYLAIMGGVIFLAGGALELSPTAINIAKWVMIAGMVLIVVGAAKNTPGNVGAKFGAGLYDLYGISGYVGDFVSYSRLMALGLSGAYIALSVNTIAKMMFGSPVGIVFGVVVLIAFHAFNVFLSYLGAYVHGMRLIYVEFFGKFYEGGGKRFRVFRSESKYINLDRKFED